MSFTSYLDLYRPGRAMEQFGAICNPEEMSFCPFTNYMRTMRPFFDDSASKMCTEKDKFCLCVDVHQFKPYEITVKTIGRMIMIEGKHEERQDEHGFISRQFMRKYQLPECYESEDVTSNLTADGILMIEAKKKEIGSERIVPINKIAAIYKKKDTAQNIKESTMSIKETKKEENGMIEKNGKKESEIMMTDFKKMDCSKEDFKKSAKDERCCLLNSDGTVKFSSDLNTEAMKAAKTCSTQERIDFSSSSMTSEMSQSKESSFISTETSCGMRGAKTDFISDIITAELKQASDNL